MMYCFMTPSDPDRVLRWSSLCLDRDVFERRGIGETRDQVETRLRDSRSDGVDKPELPDRRVDRLLVDELLHLFEDRRALLVVELLGLLRVERIDIGIAAIGKGAVLDDKGGKPGGGIAKGAARPLNDPARVFLGGISGEKTGTLDRLQLEADADRREIVQRHFSHIRIRGVAVQQTRVEPV